MPLLGSIRGVGLVLKTSPGDSAKGTTFASRLRDPAASWRWEGHDARLLWAPRDPLRWPRLGASAGSEVMLDPGASRMRRSCRPGPGGLWAPNSPRSLPGVVRVTLLLLLKGVGGSGLSLSSWSGGRVCVALQGPRVPWRLPDPQLPHSGASLPYLHPTAGPGGQGGSPARSRPCRALTQAFRGHLRGGQSTAGRCSLPGSDSPSRILRKDSHVCPQQKNPFPLV